MYANLSKLPPALFDPLDGLRNHQSVHECKVYEVSLACPDTCGGELIWTGESMSGNYGPQLHHHACSACRKVWLIKGQRYPWHQHVRSQYVVNFRQENTAAKE